MSEELETEREKTTVPPKKRRAQPVMIYLAVLSVAVITILILSYAIQRRNYQHLEDLNQTVTDIQSSYSTMISINDLQAEISTLNAQLDQSQTELADCQTQLAALQSQLDRAETDAETAMDQALNTLNCQEALENLYLLEALYQSGDLTSAAQLLSEIKEAGYDTILSNYQWEHLLTQSDGIASPAQRYQEIKTAVEQASTTP